MERAVFVYTTHLSTVEAERIGCALLERRLCACVNILPGNILPGMISHHSGRAKSSAVRNAAE
jgi:hypothetical protein